MKRSIIAIALVAAMGALWYVAVSRRSGAAPALASPPNLILVTIDTLRADRVGAYGGPREISPNMDALATRGALFLDATAHAPLTVPSHVSIMTGQLPASHGVRDNAGFLVPPATPTLAERLKARGYRTAAFVGAFVLGGGSGLSRGFDTYADRFDTARAKVSYSQLQRPGAEVVRDALAWIVKASDSRAPLFVWVHIYDPHAPYAAPPVFAGRFPGQPYNAEVAAADWALGDLLHGLPASMTTHTVTIVTADHGESLDEHGEPEHGIFVYDSTLRVPLIVQGPGWPAGTRIAEQVRHIDLLPTILVSLGLPLPTGLPGEDLRPLAGGRPRPAVPVSYAESWFGRLHFGWSELRAVRSGDWKYVRAPRPELYDLRTDPLERRNIAAERPDITARLASDLASVTDSSRSASTPAPVGAAALERLQSLGYVGGGTLAQGSVAGADPKDHIAEYVDFVTAFYAALDRLERGQAAAALTGFRSLATRHPLSYEAHQYVGRALFELGRFREALAEYDVVAKLKPDFAAGYFDAGAACARLRQFDQGRTLAQKGLRLDAGSFYGQYVLGLIESESGRPDEAAKAFELALAINPGMALAHFELGRLAERRGAYAAAVEHYRQALAADEDFADARRAVERIGLRRPEMSR